jgi:hypothetical protein
MTKKGVYLTIAFVLFAGIGVVIVKHRPANPDLEIETVMNTPEKSYDIQKFHSDILNLIVAANIKIYNISPQEAQAVLDSRIGNEDEADKTVPNVRDLPFDIVRLIAQSPASIAGIPPKKAWNEVARRSLEIDVDDVNSEVLLNVLHQKQNHANLEKWAKNEDAEAAEKFMKEEADRDSSSVANVIYALKNINNNDVEAKTYMERYAEHVDGDAYDTANEKEAANLLINAFKKSPEKK